MLVLELLFIGVYVLAIAVLTFVVLVWAASRSAPPRPPDADHREDAGQQRHARDDHHGDPYGRRAA